MWLNGLCHGKGKLIIANEKIQEGEFIEGKLEGVGSEIWKNEIYYGCFLNGIRDGYGKLTQTNNIEYVGKFKNGKLYGEGEVNYEDKHFFGVFNHNEAEGTMEYADGSKFIGKIVNFLEEGKGIYEKENNRKECVMSKGKKISKSKKDKKNKTHKI